MEYFKRTSNQSTNANNSCHAKAIELRHRVSDISLLHKMAQCFCERCNNKITLNKIRGLSSTKKQRKKRDTIVNWWNLRISARCIRTSLKWKKKGIIGKLECKVGIPLIKCYKKLGLQSSVTVYYICTRQSSYAQLTSKPKQNITVS